MIKEVYESYYVVGYIDVFLIEYISWDKTDENNIKKVKDYKFERNLELAKKGTYEQADRLAKLYGGKVKKVVTYTEDVKGYE